MGRLECMDVARTVLGEPRRRTGQEYFFRCPNHDDQHPSLQINQKKNVWMCGPCGASGNAWQLAAFIGGLDPNDRAKVVSWLKGQGLSNDYNGTGLTVSAYAKSKSLPEDFLRSLGLRDSRHGKKTALLIPYYDVGGKPVAFRFRQSMSGPRSEKFRWKKGTTPLPYGLWLLATARKIGHVALVEGESDCHTLWYHDIPAIGVPGAGTWQDGWGAFLEDIPIIYVLVEPDRGGETLQNKLLASPICSRLRFSSLDGVKDPSELYLRDPARFRHAWDSAIRATFPLSVEGAPLLREIVQFIRRFVALTESQAQVIALWVVHSHAFEVADTTPYLSISSAEKQSGKTRLLEVLDLLVANPWFTSRVSPAVLVRKIAAEQPTLLLDESDAAFKGPEEYSETLRGILNSGHRRGGKTSLCVGQGANIRSQDFPTFSPKAIAGIGNLPDTVADRSIPIRLKRRSTSEKVERFRGRSTPAEARPLRNRLAVWASARINDLRQAAPPDLPGALSDRQQDGVEPLFMIANLAGGDWPETATRAVVSLCCGAQAANDSVSTLLLSDIRQIFTTQHVDVLPSVELATALVGIETSPWGEWRHGRPITPVGVARLLRPFDISPRPVRSGDQVFRGYEKTDFVDAWERYLGADDKQACSTASDHPCPPSVTSLQAAPNAASSDFRAVTASEIVTALKLEKTAQNAACNAVTPWRSPTDRRTDGMEEEL